MVTVQQFPELTFEERRHVYRLNGVEIPSVTTIMGPLSEQVYATVNDAVLRKAGARGTAVHNAIENYVKFGIEDIATEYAGYFDAFLQWCKDHKVVPYASEVRLYHKALLYAGTADLLASVDKEDTLVDFKTTSSMSEMLCGVQLEAYKRAHESHEGAGKLSKKAILHLSKNGKYEMFHFNPHDTECWKVFTALLTVRNYKQKFR